MAKRKKGDFDELVKSYNQSVELEQKGEIKIGFLFYLKYKHQSAGNFKSANILNTAVAKDLIECVSTANQLQSLSLITKSIAKIFQKIKKCKNYDRDWDSIVNFLNSPYSFPSSVSSTSTSPETATASASLVSPPSRLNCSSCATRRSTIKKLRDSVKDYKDLPGEGRKYRQALQRKIKIESDLRDQRRILTKKCALQAATIKKLCAENQKLKEAKYVSEKIRNTLKQVEEQKLLLDSLETRISLGLL